MRCESKRTATPQLPFPQVPFVFHPSVSIRGDEIGVPRLEPLFLSVTRLLCVLFIG